MKTQQMQLITSTVLLACISFVLGSQVANYDKEGKIEKENYGKTQEKLKVQGQKVDPTHPALSPGFPYIWPYLHSPYQHPYFWPMYLYHGQYAPFHPQKHNLKKTKDSKQAPYMETLVFIGKFAGTCKAFPNGLYYIDNRSFAYCSNGIKTVQNCPEGAENPQLSEFYKGLYRFVHDFCSVNLLVNKVPIHPEAFLHRFKERNAKDKQIKN